jgi:hypothetical protein
VVFAADVTSVVQELDSVLSWGPCDVILDWDRDVDSFREVSLVQQRRVDEQIELVRWSFQEPLVHRDDDSLDSTLVATVGECPVEWSLEEQYHVYVVEEPFYSFPVNTSGPNNMRAFWVPFSVCGSYSFSVWMLVDHDAVDYASIKE